MKRDIYSEVSDRIVTELEAGARRGSSLGRQLPARTRRATPSPIALTRDAMSFCCGWHKRAGYRTPRYLTFKQALELGGNVRKGEHGTRVYFVKQLQVRDKARTMTPQRASCRMTAGVHGFQRRSVRKPS